MKPSSLVAVAAVVVVGAIGYQVWQRQAGAAQPPGSGLNFGFNFSKFGN